MGDDVGDSIVGGLRTIHGGATTTGPDATYPQLSVKTRGGGRVGGGGVWPGVGGGVWPGVGGGVRLGVGGGSYQGSGGGSCRGSGGVWPGVRGASDGVRGRIRVGVGVKVRVKVSRRVRVSPRVTVRVRVRVAIRACSPPIAQI